MARKKRDSAAARWQVSVKGFIARLEAIVIFVASFALAALVIAKHSLVATYLGTVGFFAYPIAILIIAIVASAPFSVTDALAVMNGVIFGPLWGSVVNALGIVLAAVIGYVIALRTSKLLDLEAQIARLPRWVRRFRPGSPAFLVFVRIIPGIGGTLATQTAAALRVPIFVQILTMAAAANFVNARIVTPAKSYVNRHRPHMHYVRPHAHETP